jgi:hypothetical protein
MKVYRHFKNGKLYTVEGRCTRESDLEHMVLYCDNTRNPIWVRPESEFFGSVQVGGIEMPRFEEVKKDGK